MLPVVSSTTCYSSPIAAPIRDINVVRMLLVLGISFFCISTVPLAVIAQEEASSSEEAIKSQIERLRLTIKYGTDSEVVDILPLLIEQRITEFSADLQEIVNNSNNSKLLEAAIRFFRELQIFSIEARVLELLKEHDDHNEKLILELLSYLKASPELSPPLRMQMPIVGQSDRVVVARSALDVLAVHGTVVEGAYLTEIITDSDKPDDVRGGAILAVGEIGYSAAQESLSAILDDISEPIYLRRYAATSLGKLQQPSSVAQLKAYLNDPNATLRAQVIEALGNYSMSKINAILNEALRDSHWQVRSKALEALEGRQLEDSLYKAVQYKAEYDPDFRVRREAIAFLADNGRESSFHFLRQLLERPNITIAQRAQVVELLVSKDYAASRSQLLALLHKHISYRRSTLLLALAQALGSLDAPQAAELYRTLLESNSREVLLYALQGIGRNNLRELESHVAKLQEENGDREIQRRAALVRNRWLSSE